MNKLKLVGSTGIEPVTFPPCPEPNFVDAAGIEPATSPM